MKNILYFDLPIDEFIKNKKTVVLSFSSDNKEFFGMNIKLFKESEVKKGFEVLKRFVSSRAFDVIVLNNFVHLLNDSPYIDEIVIWLNDHITAPDSPTILLTNHDDLVIPSLLAEKYHK